MKIVSPFQDYYDHAVHPSQVDNRILFVRKTKTVDFDFEGSLEGASIGTEITYRVKTTFKGKDEYNYLTLRTALLAIGNKAYQIMVPAYIPVDEKDFLNQRNGFTLAPWGSPSKETYLKHYKNYLSEHGDVQVEITESEPYQTPRWMLRYVRGNRKHDERFVYVGPINVDTTALCMHYQSPVVLVAKLKDSDSRYGTTSKRKVIVNPPLKAFNMMTEIDSFQTWQEISMWIGGVMPGGQSPMVQISDTSKIIKAGFDPKISFRKRKET